jgi:hypothetical protein
MNPSQQHLPPELRDPTVPAALVRALQTAYEVSQDRHDPSVGDDAMTFGIHVWKSGAHYLAAAVTDAGGDTALINQSLSMRFGDAELRHHKLGDTENDNPSTSFPNHAGPAARMHGRASDAVQLELELPEAEAVERRMYLDWVLGSYGNPADGLRAVRLQAVGEHRALDGTISRWEDVVTLFDVSLGTSLAAPPIAADMPPEEITPEPDVELQPDQDERDDEQPQ